MRVTSFLFWGLLYGSMVFFSLVPHLLKTAGESDKVLHVFSYCLLTLIPFFLLSSWRWRFAIAGALFLTGAANEILQDLVGGRTASVLDALSNGVGILLGAWVAVLLRSGFAADPRPGDS